MMNHKDFNIRQYAWDYFQLHAEQRLKTFEFYIVIATVLLSGYVISLKEDNLIHIGIVIGILLIVLSFVFWKLDVRNKQLIKNAEQALKTIEDELISESNGDVPHNFKLFHYDDFKIKKERQRTRYLFWNKHFSYSNCFNIMFVVFAILGIIAILWTACCLNRHNGKSLKNDVKSECILKDNTEIKEFISGDIKRK